MARRLRAVLALTCLGIVSLAIGACRHPSRALQPKPPAFEPGGTSKCSVAKNQSEPLIVEWPSAARAQLESAARKGVVVVSYEGCTMRLLSQCSAPGSYGYVPLTRKRDRVAVHDADELYANLPLGAASLEGKLATSGELNVTMTIVGRWESSSASFATDALVGDCAKATHVVTGLTAGAFRFVAGAAAEIEAEVEAAAIGGVGGKSASNSEVLNEDGEEAACAQATDNDKKPPYGCGALLRLEVVPIGASKAVEATCAPGLVWNGSQCVSAKASTKCSSTNVDACTAECNQGTASACLDAALWVASKDLARARELYDRACVLGDASGCGNLAGYLVRGWGGAKDHPKALALYQKGCAQANSLHCHQAGRLLLDGEGVPRDTVRAAALFEKGCKGNVKNRSAQACYELARAYANGTGVPTDERKAFELFEQACTGSFMPLGPSSDACVAVGSAHLTGRGTTKNVEKGFAALEKSCATSTVGKGCVQLGDAYLQLTKDAAKADAAYRRGCEAKKRDLASCWQLGELHRDFTKDAGKAEAAFGATCQAGLAPGCVEYAKARSEQKKPAADDLVRAEVAKWSEQCSGAASNAQLGCAFLAFFTQAGFGLPKDEPKALSMFEKACASGVGFACTYAGQAFEKGIGTKPDAANARVLFGKSCTARVADGCRELARMLEKGIGGSKDPVQATSCKQLAAQYDDAAWSAQWFGETAP